MIGGKGRLGSPGSQGPAGAAGADAPTFASFVRWAMQGYTCVNSSGSNTVGYTFTVLAGGGTFRGVNLRWKNSGSTDTVKVSIWDPSNVLVAASVVTFTLANAGDGYFYMAFAAPLTLAAGTYTIGVFQNNSRYCSLAVTPTASQNLGGNYVFTTATLYSAGDARPASVPGSEKYWIVELVPST